ncbi:MAG: hypothetical protein ABSG62_04860 [Terracidiphilus sp.]|jgi:hypothetical protein
MKWEFLHPGGNSSLTVFAGDDELLAFLHLRYRVAAGVAFPGAAFVAITATTSAPRAKKATPNATQSSGSKATAVFLPRGVIALIFGSSSIAAATS